MVRCLLCKLRFLEPPVRSQAVVSARCGGRDLDYSARAGISSIREPAVTGCRSAALCSTRVAELASHQATELRRAPGAAEIGAASRGRRFFSVHWPVA